MKQGAEKWCPTQAERDCKMEGRELTVYENGS